MVDIEYDMTIVNGGLSLFIKQHTQEGAIPGGLRTSYMAMGVAVTPSI